MQYSHWEREVPITELRCTTPCMFIPTPHWGAVCQVVGQILVSHFPAGLGAMSVVGPPLGDRLSDEVGPHDRVDSK